MQSHQWVYSFNTLKLHLFTALQLLKTTVVYFTKMSDDPPPPAKVAKSSQHDFGGGCQCTLQLQGWMALKYVSWHLFEI